MTKTHAAGRCSSCAHFRNDPEYLEAIFKGITSLSSGYGSTGGEDGICTLHDRHLSARSSCAKYAAAPRPAVAVASDATLKANAERAIERVLME